MDVSSSVFQLQDDCGFRFDCEDLLERSFGATDAGYHSASSSLSPASSTDSSCFSPPTFHPGPGHESFSEVLSESLRPPGAETENRAPRRTGRPRSKFPGVKRQNASEREKLRMRDLTKALQHLRTYLPPSVAPAGQTLTKIETLRLAVRYISQLSAQLEPGQEKVPPARPHPDVPVFHANPDVPQMSSFSGQEFFSMPNTPYYQSSDNSMISLPASPAQDFWITQQQYGYYGQC